MEITLNRNRTVKDTTTGKLYVGAVFQCYTLEDAIRETKIKGVTAIPKGRYRIVLEDSPRFGPDTMTLLEVPGFTHIRIHGGNDDADTDGCILVGDALVDDPAGDGGNIAGGTSQPALRRLKDRVKGAILRGEQVFIEINQR